jgi:hypothetical protein
MLLLMYCGGIAAIAAGRYDYVRNLLYTPVLELDRMNRHGHLMTVMAEAVSDLSSGFQSLFASERRYTPRSDHLFTTLQPQLDDLFFLGRGYEDIFDKFEILWALEVASWNKRQEPMQVSWPRGRFVWNTRALTDCVHEAKEHAEAWPPIAAGLVDGDPQRFFELVDELDKRPR